ncbi:MAG: UDP-glucose dehydrogenase family protein [Microthrixaceae bacterium]|jgi:UDPglucose 6-dehydrogenase
MRSSVAVVGTGYVGLTTGACLAHLGHEVTCVDIDPAKIERLNRADIHILEDGLEELVVEGLRSGRLTFTTDTAAAVAGRSFVCLCVPSPQADDGSADLSFIRAAAAEMGPHLDPGAVVINKSTVPVGSTGEVSEALGREDVSVVSNPEFLREGSAVHDFLHPDRVVIGADDEVAAMKMVSLYVGLTAPIVVTDPASSELIKYASNAFLAAKLSFINEVADLARALGADIDDVVLGVGSDPRIGRNHLRPGPGWGGSCLPKDTRAMLHMASQAGQSMDLLEAVVAVNESRFDRTTARLAELVGGSLDGVRIAVWGLTFKGGTDDLRSSPSLAVLSRAVDAGAEIVAYDPTVAAGTQVLDGVTTVDDPYAACAGARALAVLTDWQVFRHLDLDQVVEALAEPRLLDAHNLLDRQTVERCGFDVARLDS